MNEVLRQRLLAMRAEDERVRAELAATGELFDGYNETMERVHLKNAAELEAMINEHGWLGKSLVGADGADAAWLIVQHAISLPDFSRRCLKLIEQAVAENEAEPKHAAYLHDRICFFERRPQKYGTQSDWNAEGKMAIWTLEDADKVNEYRREVGLPPLENLVWENEETKGSSPKNRAERQKSLDKWSTAVGWTK